jgi:hypothetical protein
MVSTGCGGHDWTSQSTPNSAQQVAATHKVPTIVEISSTPVVVGLTAGAPVMGACGVALDGISIYSPSDAEENDAGTIGRNAVKFEGASLGHCGAHPTGSGAYHYHAMPGVKPTNCVADSSCDNRNQICCGETIEGSVCAEFTSSTAEYAWLGTAQQSAANAFGTGSSSAGLHSLLVGFMADGIPIYGFNDVNGTPPTDLDECNGHVTALGYYHYHATTTYPYTVSPPNPT